MSALLLAVVDRLQDQLVVTDDQCRVMPDEKAIPIAGQEFISVYGSLWGQGDPDLDMGIDEYYDVDCTIAHRIRFAPGDRWGSNVYVKATTGLEARARRIIVAIHKNYTTMALANARISDTHKIIEPLRWAGVSANPYLVTNDHYQGPVENEDLPAGLAMTVSFKDARRVQTISTMG